ncbi:MAG: hypothetical protein PHQ35_04265 [Phycisphaerae bacterium]|nr:hypothetical protein [Phycisphaerae bacterium]
MKSITFSKDGVCNVCTAAKQSAQKSGETEPSEDELNKIIENIRARGRGSDFDCLVGLSGGRDSSYLMYLLTQKHKLRVLATYYRTPFTPDVIEENVRRIVKQLNVKLVEIKLPWDLHLKVAKKYFLLWQKKPLPEIANLTCVVCKLVNREVFRIAKAHNIKSIVCGGNRYEELQILPAFRDEDLTDKAHSFRNQLLKMLQTFKKGLSLLSKCPSVIRYLPISVKVSLLYITLHTPYLRLRYHDIYCVDYFFNAEWNEAECIETIQSKLGWQPPPGSLGTWKADCDFADIKNYMFQKTTGATYAEAMLSNLIRDGQITREEALKRLGDTCGISKIKIQRALDKLGLPPIDKA